MLSIKLSSPYDAPHLYDILFDQLDFDLAYWTEVGQEAGGPVLELGCGTGRVLLPLRAAGIDADGLDASRLMIGRLRWKARQRGIDVRTVVADMRNFKMPRRYERIFCAFNGFAHCETTEDQIAAIRCCRKHLKPEGALILHMSYPGPKYWLEPDADPVFEAEAKDPATGRMIQLWDHRAKDPVAQVQRSRVEYRELDEKGVVVKAHAFSTSQRWVYRFELELLFLAAGFTRWTIYGGFDGKPVQNPEDQMIAWAWRG
jgi:SAM-dependent methyltransferase